MTVQNAETIVEESLDSLAGAVRAELIENPDFRPRKIDGRWHRSRVVSECADREAFIDGPLREICARLAVRLDLARAARLSATGPSDGITESFRRVDRALNRAASAGGAPGRRSPPVDRTVSDVILGSVAIAAEDLRETIEGARVSCLAVITSVDT